MRILPSARWTPVAVIRQGFEGGDFAAGLDFDPVRACCVGEALHDGLRGIGCRKHAPVGFGLEVDAVLVKPSDGVGSVEAMKGAMQAAVSSGIVLDEFAGVGAVVGDVAATAAGDADFGEDLFRLFENEDGSDSLLGGGDGSKEPGGPSADDDELIVVFGHELS